VQRRQYYAVGAVAASLSYVGTGLASTGEFDVLRWAAFVAGYLLAFAAGEALLARTGDGRRG
jgi:hypothetical protein